MISTWNADREDTFAMGEEGRTSVPRDKGVTGEPNAITDSQKGSNSLSTDDEYFLHG